jgi:hypothetical protein
MTVIPEEYSSFDYGFSAVSEIPSSNSIVTTTQSIDENDITRVLLNALRPVEDKLDVLLTRKAADEGEDFTFALSQAEQDYKNKIQELEKIIMPLLVNLLKTADKDYIFWPDRAPIIQGAIDKVLKITRS